jgi:hypothetical protein
VTGQVEVELDRGARWKAQVSWFRSCSIADLETPREGLTPRDVHWCLHVVIGDSQTRAAAAEGVQMANRGRAARMGPRACRASPGCLSQGARRWTKWLLPLLFTLSAFFGTSEQARFNCPTRVTGQVEVTLDRGARWKAQVSWFRSIFIADLETPREAGFFIELDVLRKELDE